MNVQNVRNGQVAEENLHLCLSKLRGRCAASKSAVLEWSLCKSIGFWHSYLDLSDISKFLLCVHKDYRYLAGAVTQAHFHSTAQPSVSRFLRYFGLFHRIRHVSMKLWCVGGADEDENGNGNMHSKNSSSREILDLALFENLTHLRVGTADYTVQDHSVEAVLTRLSRLKEVDIGYSVLHTLHLDGSGSSAAKKSTLSTLRLREAPDLCLLKWPMHMGRNIRVLELGYCRAKSANLEAFLTANSQTLQRVTLCACSRVTSLHLDSEHFPALEWLDLRYCGRLKSLRLGAAPKLHSLCLKQCLALETLEINEMSARLTMCREDLAMYSEGTPWKP